MLTNSRCNEQVVHEYHNWKQNRKSVKNIFAFSGFVRFMLLFKQ